MAFPANYNIQYYQGDTYQFVIRPKTSAGDIFPLDELSYNSYFKIDTERGRAEGLGRQAVSSISDNSVICTITPELGDQLDAGTLYFYDVAVADKENSDIVYTLLTGTITITADIAGP